MTITYPVLIAYIKAKSKLNCQFHNLFSGLATTIKENKHTDYNYSSPAAQKPC